MDKLIIEFNKKFNKQKQELIDGFKALGEEKRLPKALATIEGEQPTYKDYFKAGWQSRQAEVDEKDKRIVSQSNCIENLVVRKSDYLDKVTKAIAHLDSFDHSKASINKLQRSIECALEALRGEHE